MNWSMLTLRLYYDLSEYKRQAPIDLISLPWPYLDLYVQCFSQLNLVEVS